MDEFYTQHWEKGVYSCEKCENPLFESRSKFDAGALWPTFREAIPGAVSIDSENNIVLNGARVSCAKCQHALGQLFHKAGLRYVILSHSLQFDPEDERVFEKAKAIPRFQFKSSFGF